MGLFSKKKLTKEELVKTTRNTTIICLFLTLVLLVVFPLGAIILGLATIIWAYRYWQAKKALHGNK